MNLYEDKENFKELIKRVSDETGVAAVYIEAESNNPGKTILKPFYFI